MNDDADFHWWTASSELPGGAPVGFGSATDFRRLLAVHPRPAKKPSRPAPATPTTGPRSTRPRPARLASAPAGSAGSGEGSALPIVAGILLLAVGLAAVVHAARDGRI